MLELLALIWFLIGFFGYIHAWTAEFDLHAEDLFMASVSGMLGPIGAGLMYAMIRERKGPIVILKKRLK